MAWRISGAAIRRPTPSILLFIVLTILGVLAFGGLPITRTPNIDVPVVSVTITQEGAAPSELETQVTKQVEDGVADVAGIKHVTSSITDGSSATLIEFRIGTDTDRALNDVKDALSRIRAALPRTIDEPIVQRIDVAGQSIQTFAAAAPGLTLERLSWFVDDTVLRDLQGVPGVGRVDRIGGVTQEIRVSLDPDRLSSMGITAGQVSAQVRATNVDLAGGRGEVGGHEQAVRTLAGRSDIDQLAATHVTLPGDRELRLSDLGSVTDSYAEPRGFARLDGATPVVAFAVFRAKGASDVTVAGAVGKRLDAIRAAHPEVRFTLIDDSVRSTYGSYASAMHSLIEGALLATLVVFIFLRDWRATLLAAIALPLSILPAFWAMQLMGFSLNFVSLLAITLVTGILVDDAIVEIENIVRHIRMGKPPYRAAMEAADEIGLAVVAITLTIVAIFAPVSFMGGIAGQYFKQFGLTVAAAVLFSLLVARLLTPVLAAHMLRPQLAYERSDGRVMRAYGRLLRATLARPGVTLAVGVAVFALSLWSTTLLPTGFIPSQDNARAVLSLELPPGSTLEATRAKTDEAARRLKRIPEVTTVYVVGGTTPTGETEIRRASLVVNLTRKQARQRTQKQIEAEISRTLAGVADLRAWYVSDRGEREFTVRLRSNDRAALDRVVPALESQMRHLAGFSNVAASAGIDRPEIRIVPRTDEASRLGISSEMIADAVRIATIGDIDANLGKFRDGDRLVPIRVELDRAVRDDLSAFGALPVVGATGQSVPLFAVADLGFGQGPSSIDRYDRSRVVLLGADLAEGLALGDAVKTIHALPAARLLPAGVHLQNGGDAEIMDEVFDSFATAIGAGLMIVLAVLVLLFGSFLQPLTILLSLPLSIGGVILALLVTRNPISLPVVIGILMLLGIVTKNAIMLVDFAIEAQARGVDRVTAILEAGRMRARPIVMTTIAMVAGMVPSALGLGDGGEFRAPMAIGVIGGLIVSTLLSLVFVPSFYVLVEQLKGLGGRLLRGRRVAAPPVGQPAE